MELAYIPSPSTGVLQLGPLPLRGYALCIILGVFVAVWYGNKRWIARGGKAGTVADIAVWAVPFGLVGGRLYHVITDYQLYFSDGENWVDAFKIWQGGLGIWGAIALGAVGAWIGCRRRGIPLPAWADAMAPAIVIAQAIGRWGNWFNQELYGKPTDLPWALKISEGANREAGLYHPTFLYESLWCIGVALLVVWADRRFKLGHGRAFALYVAAYCAGRAWIEYMRVDEAHEVLGLRLNVWTSIVVFVLAVVYIVVSARVRPGREEIVEPERGTSGTAGGSSADKAPKADKAVKTDKADTAQAVQTESAKNGKNATNATNATNTDGADSAVDAEGSDGSDPSEAPGSVQSAAAGTDGAVADAGSTKKG